MVGHTVQLNRGLWEGAVRCIEVFNSKIDVGNIIRDPVQKADVFALSMNVIDNYVAKLNATGDYEAVKVGNPIPDPPVDPPIPPEPGSPNDTAIEAQARRNLQAEDRSTELTRFDTEYDRLGGGRNP